MKNPFAHFKGTIPEIVPHVLANDGFYIGSDPSAPAFSRYRGEIMLAVLSGRVYSLKIDAELDPERFINGQQIEGPFRATAPDENTKGIEN